jgi:hypothetical protein
MLSLGQPIPRRSTGSIGIYWQTGRFLPDSLPAALLYEQTKSPAGAGLSFEAAEEIRTLDLLHGKQTL